MSAALALLSSLLWGTADYLGGTASRRLPTATVVLASQAGALALLVPLVLFVDAGPLRAVLLTGIAAGLVGPAALLAFYRALAIGTMGVVAPVAALGVAVPVVGGLASGESPSAGQLAGIGVALVGVVLASGPELRGDDGACGAGGRSLGLALVAAIGFGSVFLLLARGTGNGDGVGPVLLLLVVMRATSVLVLGGLVLLRRGRGRSARGDLRRAAPVLVLVGACDVAANGTFAVASQTALVSVTAVLSSLYPIVTGVLAWRLHGERLARVQWWGVGLAVTGVALLAGG